MTSIKKMKGKVGMATLKSKQTRVVGITSTHMVHPYTCFMGNNVSQISALLHMHVDEDGEIRVHICTLMRKGSVGIYQVCADYPYYVLLFIYFLALPFLLYLSILSDWFYTCRDKYSSYNMWLRTEDSIMCA